MIDRVRDDLSVTDNTNVVSVDEIISPKELIERYPVSEKLAKFILENRQITSNILRGIDDKLIVIAGPCSVHDTKAAIEYAHFIKEMKKENPDLHIIMRTYFEKPRTTVGWKGMINDPHLDNSFDVEEGLRRARELLLTINELGVPVSLEILDPISPQYLGDLVTWSAIGARTTESQIHREIASATGSPVGFKNGTSGDTKVAENALQFGSNPQKFLGVSKEGKNALISSTGNKDLHIILRGGDDGTNYKKADVDAVIKRLEKKGVDTGVIIDFSHANTMNENGVKEYGNQSKLVCPEVASQIAEGNIKIAGVMIESHLYEGNQPFTPGETSVEDLEYGKSITDPCENTETSSQMFDKLSQSVVMRRAKIQKDEQLVE
ncbi:3-deoxy-7-phosphoheptulonate synthase [Candidatus Gracilibacteria bacterium]|nr:3-deoxy-7-phosphoheptulonate synthase [Candidatus Gracilibacteria bacterium]